VHTCPAAQTRPQAPQLALSLCVSAQYDAPAAVQSVPLPQSLTHLPATQRVAVGHIVPQAPQLVASECRFAQ
jgi:hypothetical protein